MADAERLAPSVQSGGQAALEGLRVEAVEEPLEGIVRGNAVGQVEEAGEPVLALPTKGFDVGPGVGAADDGTDGDGQDVDERVQSAVLAAGAFQAAEVLGDSERNRRATPLPESSDCE